MRSPVDVGSSATLSFHGAESRPIIPDHDLLRRIGKGSYGEVWLARSITGAYRAVKVVYPQRFEDQRPFEREFRGIQKFEPISRLHASQVHVLHFGRKEAYFYYVMELADDAEASRRRKRGFGLRKAKHNWRVSTRCKEFNGYPRTTRSAPSHGWSKR